MEDFVLRDRMQIVVSNEREASEQFHKDIILFYVMDDSYRIVCHNMKQMSSYYYLVDENKVEKDKIYRCFEDRNVLEQVIYLDDVKDGTYQIKIQRINEQNGSILGIWQDLDFCMNLTREEVKYFRKVCEPRLMIQTCRSENHTIEVRLKLEPNEIVLVKIDEAV